MHKYLRAIGFSNIERKNEAKELIEDIILRPSYFNQYNFGKDAALHQCDKYYDSKIGISILRTRSMTRSCISRISSRPI